MNDATIIAIIIIGVFLIIAAILSFRTRYREKTLNKYETFTEELVKKPNPPKEEESDDVGGGFSFMQIAISMLGIGVVLMVGASVISQVSTSMDSTTSMEPTIEAETSSESFAEFSVFAVFGLVAIGIIMIAAFGLINIFR